MAIWRLAVIAAAAITASGAPVVVYDTFGPGDTWMVGPGITFGCGSICWGDAGHTLAFGFTPIASGTLERIDTAVAAFTAARNTVDLAIWSDAGNEPGSPLETFPLMVGTSFSVVSADSATHPALTQGQRFWFVFAVPDPLMDAAQVAINPLYPDASHPGPSAYRIGDSGWSVYNGTIDAVFRVTVDASAVPEPSSAIPLGAALIAGVIVRYGARRP